MRNTKSNHVNCFFSKQWNGGAGGVIAFVISLVLKKNAIFQVCDHFSTIFTFNPLSDSERNKKKIKKL